MPCYSARYSPKRDLARANKQEREDEAKEEREEREAEGHDGKIVEDAIRRMPHRKMGMIGGACWVCQEAQRRSTTAWPTWEVLAGAEPSAMRSFVTGPSSSTALTALSTAFNVEAVTGFILFPQESASAEGQRP